jgi:S-adenosylmethionine decarboxylase proenzyme
MAGKHIILDLYEVDPNIMIKINNDGISVKEWNMLLNQKFKEANVNCLNVSWHNFNNEGAFTSLYLLSESHLSIHTWPEKSFIAVDIFTCGDSNIDILSEFIITYFNPGKKELKKFCRGNLQKIEEESNNSNSIKTNSSFVLSDMESVFYY